MKTQTKRPVKDRPSSRRTIPKSKNTRFTTPILTGFYYAVEDAHGYGFSIVQVVDIAKASPPMRIKLRQFAPSFKALPDFLVPKQLGTSVAQFWLALDDFNDWQPLLMQRGVVDKTLLS